ncbi:hypothetical protein [Haloarchaeobius sp. TZWSO28]|uniref:hypothetical protein n=1 Tax=Haloarchaeobius sp. TZWSO28 TaxID=3446119 RepID=UPI003EB85A3C
MEKPEDRSSRLPIDTDDLSYPRELARDLAVGRTRDVLDLDFSPSVFADDMKQRSRRDSMTIELYL